MSPLLPALLGLGLCLSWRIKAQEDILPKPSLWAEPGHLMPEGKPVTIWCQSPLGASSYRLEKQGTAWFMESTLPGNKTSFFLGEMKAEAAGVYRCQYRTSSGYSESSEALMLIMIGRYDKPVLSARPGTVVAPGETVTLHCQSFSNLDGFMLSKDQGGNETFQYEWNSLPFFTITAVTAAHGGTYRCHTFQNAFPYVWSAPSNPLVLRVTDTTEKHSLPDPRPPNPTNRTTFPRHSDLLFGLPRLTAGILMGILALIILIFFLLLFFLLRYWRQRQTRLKTRGKEIKLKKTLKSSDSAWTPLKENLYENISEDRQTEVASPEHMTTPPREDLQKVTYTELNINSFKFEAKDPSSSGPGDPSLYATLR